MRSWVQNLSRIQGACVTYQRKRFLAGVVELDVQHNCKGGTCILGKKIKNNIQNCRYLT